MKYQQFRDFDEFSSAVGDIDGTMLLQNRTRRSWSIYHAYLDEIHLQLGQLGSGNIVEGQSWSNGYLFYMPLTEGCAYSGNGTVFDKNSFLILEPGCDFCISTKAEHDWCSIFVPTHKISRGGDLMGRNEKMMCRVRSVNRQVGEEFRMLVHQIMTTASNCLEFESSSAATCAASKLLEVASLVVSPRQSGKPNPEGRPKLSRQEIIRRSKDLLEEREGNHVLVGELAVAAGVSERTLRTAFKDYFGVGPIRYLQLRQLHQVYRALRIADPEEVSVSDVLIRYGVWNFSRCALRYRQIYGELPSQTLHR